MAFIKTDNPGSIATIAKQSGISEISCSTLSDGKEILAKTCAIALLRSMQKREFIVLNDTWREGASLSWVSAGIVERALELLIEHDLAMFEVDHQGVIRLRQT